MLPDIGGEEICREVRKVSDIPIVMLTAKSGEANIINGIDMGADDYITKPFSPKELVARVNGTLRRYYNNFSQELVFNGGNFVIDLKGYRVKYKGNVISLTAAEYKLLTTLASNPNKVFSRNELVSLVLGYDYDGFDRTIDVHIKNLRAKIEEDNKRPKYILTVFGIGYKFGGICYGKEPLYSFGGHFCIYFTYFGNYYKLNI
jgi:DNA-binding response OmpR family regulator